MKFGRFVDPLGCLVEPEFIPQCWGRKVPIVIFCFVLIFLSCENKEQIIQPLELFAIFAIDC